MLKRYHERIGGTFRVVDAAIIACVWLLAYWGRFYLPVVEVTKGFPDFSQYAALTPLVVVLWVMVFSTFQIYRSRRMLRRTDEIFLILRAHGAAMLFFIALTYLFSEYKYSRGVILYFGFFGALGLVTVRLVLRNLLRKIRLSGYQLRRVLAVGEGGSLETLIKKIDKFPELGLKVEGVLTDPNSELKSVSGKAVIGHFGDLHKIISDRSKEQAIDQVLIALPRSQYGQLDYVLKQIGDAIVQVQVVPDVHEYVTLGCEIEDFDGLPIVNLNDSPLQGWAEVLKRITDFCFSALALVFLFPVMVFIAICVKITSKGPIFYKQTRMGVDGRTFLMYKFRSMKVDAENSSGAVWAQKDDQRRTAFGTFIRSTSIDELPQFWNVLKGEMSLVGPRPERPIFVEQFRSEIPGYMLRHKVKAGITGWAQVNGWRGNTSLSNRIEYDLYYIRNWSYALDIKILMLTVIKGFIHKNAY